MSNYTGYSSGDYDFFPDSNWSLKLSLHDIRSPSASEPNPQSHLPCRLKSPKCAVHGVTQKQQTRGTASVCACVYVTALNMNVAPRQPERPFSPGYSVWCWRCWQLCDARQQLGKHEALTSLSATYSVCLKRVEQSVWMSVWVCDIHVSICVEQCLICSVLKLYLISSEKYKLTLNQDYHLCMCVYRQMVSEWMCVFLPPAGSCSFLLCASTKPLPCHRSGCVCPCVKTAAHH